MSHFYAYQKLIEEIWKSAVEHYANGNETPDNFFTENEVDLLKQYGMRPQEMFDYAEDFCDAGEPDFATLMMIQQVRLRYFHDELNSQWSDHRIKVEDLPSKEDKLLGITWLPRIIEKTKAKLRGELPDNLMYCCGGDRRFFKEHNIHPAELLQVAYKANHDVEVIANWVKARSELTVD